jgi:hypothetical protein
MHTSIAAHFRRRARPAKVALHAPGRALNEVVLFEQLLGLGAIVARSRLGLRGPRSQRFARAVEASQHASVSISSGRTRDQRGLGTSPWGRGPPPVGASARLLPIKLAAFFKLEMNGPVTPERAGALAPMSGRAPSAGGGPSDPHKAHRVHMRRVVTHWDRLFRSLVLGGAALTGGITVVACTEETTTLSDAGERDADPADVPREGPDLGPRDADPADVPREGPDTGGSPADGGDAHVPDADPSDVEPGDVEDLDADPSDVPREGPDVGALPADATILDADLADVPREGPDA